MSSAQAHPAEENKWVRHQDFYTQDSEPGPESSSEPEIEPQEPIETQNLDDDEPPVPVAEEITEEEIRRGYWGALRKTPSILLILFIKAWRKLLSPLYGDVCSFYPSCSAYGLEAVTVHGLAKGAPLTAWRILRCNPWSGGGIDHVPSSRRVWPRGKVPKIVVLNHPSIPRDPD